MSNDRFRFRVWDIEFKKYYPASDFCIEDLQDSGDEIIVEQCTGLRDMNGRLIYEGDIVSFQSRGLFFEGTVVWTQEEVFSEINLGRFHVELLEYQGCEYEFMDYSRDRDSLEVVGNIHEEVEK